MKTLQLPLTQVAGYIYDSNGALLGRIMPDPLPRQQANELAELTCTAMNTLLGGVDMIRALNDSINKLGALVMDMDKPTRTLLDPEIESAHKAYKALFTNSKLLSKVVTFVNIQNAL